MASEGLSTALKFTFPAEGGFQNDYNDPGNWTGGSVGSGRLVGTKYGISAAAYPDLDIANLTLPQATDLYRRDYWNVIKGDQLPELMAIVTFDAAVNSGPGRAIQWLQSALEVTVDGQIGPQTIAAAQNASDSAHCAVNAVAYRLVFLTGLSLWHTEPVAFAKRMLRLAFYLGSYRVSAPVGAPSAP